MKTKLFLMVVALMSALHVCGQNVTVDDKELIGAWVLEWMQWDGEKKTICGKESGYSQFKYYGPDGEYACAELAMTKDGKVVVMPHEYGTYSFKNGVYSEMGRPSTPDGLVMTSKTQFKGRWKTLNAVWNKQTAMPDKLVKYIVDCCRMKETPADIQQLIKENVFK